MTLDLLTASSAKAARACLRLYRLRYVDGYGPAQEPEALRFGTLIHLGLEAWWRSTGDRLADALAAIQGEADPYDRAKASALLVGYDTRWGAEQYETLAVEVQFRAPLVNPETSAESRTYELAGKLDAIVRDASGRVLIVEHKTSSEDVTPGSDYWRRLRMDGQVSQYFAGARALGHDPVGCLYDVVKKPTLRPYKATPESPEAYYERLCTAIAENPGAYYARGEVVRLDSELDEHAADVWMLALTLREARRTGRYPRNPDACLSYGRTCAFFDVCTGAASLDDASRFARKAAHSELAESP